MNRVQQRLDLVLIPLDNFCESYSSAASSPAGDHSWKSPIAKTTTPLQVSFFFLFFFKEMTFYANYFR